MNPHDNWEHVREATKQFDLNPAESIMVFAMNAGVYGNREKILARLKGDLQAAISVELATIPIYLYTYYSIDRTVNSGRDLTDTSRFANEAGAVIMSVAVEEMLHMSLSSNIYFALTGAPPQLYMAAPATYPTMLPHHNPVGPPGPQGGTDTHIPLKGLSFEQLWHFLQIEYPQGPINLAMDVVELFDPELKWQTTMDPAQVTADLGKLLHGLGWPSDENWNSIGQFYSFIRCMIACAHVTEEDFQTGLAARQIQPLNYSPNNVDTIYAKAKFNKKAPAPAAGCGAVQTASKLPHASEVAVYTDEPDSHAGGHEGDWGEDNELITVASKTQAMIALQTICEQGEGYKDAFGAENNTDDPQKAAGGGGPADVRNYEPEESHFFKFLRLQAQFVEYDQHKEKLPEWMAAEIKEMELEELLEHQYAKRTAASLIDGGMVYDVPTSPVSAQYPPAYAALNDFNSGLFQYMLILSETIYLVKPEMIGPNKKVHSQQQFFNIALHRSMIWIMDKWIQMMRELDPMADGPHAGKIMGPTFENLSLGTRENAFDALVALGDRAVAASSAFDASTQSNIAHLVAKAVSLMSTDGKDPMHLPNVQDHWNGNTPINPTPADTSGAIAAE
ncbi:ferritin-like domain-containing protein [uncultured Tateyamaria sp.]|uniref:ferritin-like domain-containing protein n=1 Tax=uncultured Tateyamaria sp. TaxID=455651 RepID=UPI00261C8191|nr:ferritin-like domain-containing protein [uncultured Tateyamaria sp.]